MKKRISIFATVALCVTMGSVYATWTYAQNEANGAEDTISKTLITEDLVAKGNIVVGNNNLELTVDKATDSYKAVLSITGALEVSFEKHDLSTEDKIALQFEISATNLEYNQTPIFVLPVQAVSLGEKNNTWTIDSTNLGITMGNIELPTYADYEAFETAFDACTLTITFSEVTA